MINLVLLIENKSVVFLLDCPAPVPGAGPGGLVRPGAADDIRSFLESRIWLEGGTNLSTSVKDWFCTNDERKP